MFRFLASLTASSTRRTHTAARPTPARLTHAQMLAQGYALIAQINESIAASDKQLAELHEMFEQRRQLALRPIRRTELTPADMRRMEQAAETRELVCA